MAHIELKHRSTNRILLVGGCGYVGSYLYRKIVQEWDDCTVCDSLRRGNPDNIKVDYRCYNDLTPPEIEQYQIVIWFAGHSNVRDSTTDPSGALRNNAIDLLEFISKIPSGSKLIYASSGSLYSQDIKLGEAVKSNESILFNLPGLNAYDKTKFIFDYILENFYENFYCLRLGTVSGASPNTREELIFNAMNISAHRDGVVRLSNGEAYRSIIFLEDLWEYLKVVICGDIPRGIYNVGSMSLKIEDLARSISSFWNVPVVTIPSTSTYSFQLDTSKINTHYTPKQRTIEDHCQKFKNEYL
jgi:UDP-glucose 4-epimerase